MNVDDVQSRQIGSLTDGSYGHKQQWTLNIRWRGASIQPSKQRNKGKPENNHLQLKGSMEERRMYRFRCDFWSCLETTEMRHADSSYVKNSPCIFSGEARLQTHSWKSTSPPPSNGGNSVETHKQCFCSEGWKSYIVLIQTEWEWEEGIFVQFCPYFFYLLDKNTWPFLTQKESVDSEQLEKSQQNWYICPPSKEPLNNMQCPKTCQQMLPVETSRFPWELARFFTSSLNSSPPAFPRAEPKIQEKREKSVTAHIWNNLKVATNPHWALSQRNKALSWQKSGPGSSKTD